MDFHIVIFSRLQSYDGGRETWMNMFLPLLKNSLEKSIINVYYFKDDKSDIDRMIKSFNDERFQFFEINLPKIKNKFFSIFRILLFTKKAIYSINKNIKLEKDKQKSHILLGIGSFYEASVLSFFKLFHHKEGVKYIIWLRGVWAKETLARHSGLIHRIIINTEKYFLRKADKIIANGQDTSDAYKDYGFKSVVIPNALDFDKYKTFKDLRDVNVKKVSYIGRLSLEKGFLDFLKSVEVFNLKYPKLKDEIIFEVVGDGPLEKSLDSIKFNNFNYIGPINNELIIDYLQTIDCGVALTYSNKALGGAGVSNGLLELMASGKLIVCWKAKVFQQVLNEESAIMVEESNIDELIEGYLRLLKEPEYVRTLNENAKKVSKKYSKENHIKSFLEVIDEY